MLRSRRESLHRNGITDLAPLQQTSATKSANSGHLTQPDLGPLSADCVEKLENRGAPKISQMQRIGDFSHCKAL